MFTVLREWTAPGDDGILPVVTVGVVESDDDPPYVEIIVHEMNYDLYGLNSYLHTYADALVEATVQDRLIQAGLPPIPYPGEPR